MATRRPRHGRRRSDQFDANPKRPRNRRGLRRRMTDCSAKFARSLAGDARLGSIQQHAREGPRWQQRQTRRRKAGPSNNRSCAR